MSVSTISLKNYNYSIIKRDNCLYLHIYNKLFYIMFKNTGSGKIKLKSSNTLCVEIEDFWNRTNSGKAIRPYFIQFLKYKYYKIKFIGKGYKIKKKKKKTLFFFFNRSHSCILWWRNIHYKKLKKYKTYLRSTIPIGHIVNRILNIRLINVFTRRGLRLTRNILYKKKGKK